MKKTLLATAVLGAVMSFEVGAVTVPGELQAEMTVESDGVMTGDWALADGVNESVINVAADQAFRNADIDLGENGKLTVKAPASSVSLSNAVIGASNVTGGSDSVLTIEAGKNAGLSASTISTPEHPLTSNVTVGALNVTSDTYAIYLSGEQSLDIKADTVTLKGDATNDQKKTVFANDKASLNIHDFNVVSIDGRGAMAVSEGPNVKKMSIVSDREGSVIDLKNNSRSYGTLHSNGDQLHVKADTIKIENESGGKAVMVDRRYNTTSHLTTAKVEAKTLQVTGDVAVETTEPEAGLTGQTASLALDFSGADSFLAGDASVAGNNSSLELTFKDGARFTGAASLSGDNSSLTINLKNNAHWTVTSTSVDSLMTASAATPAPLTGKHINIDNAMLTLQAGADFGADSLSMTGGTMTLEEGASLETSKLALQGGEMTMAKDSQVVVENELSGTSRLNIVLDPTTPETEPNTAGLKLGSGTKITPESALEVGFVNEAGKELTADEIDRETAQKYQKSVIETEPAPDGTTPAPQLSTTVVVKEGNLQGGITVDSTGHAVTARNTLLDSTINLTSGSVLQLNRILMNDVRKRMGDLRASEGTQGVWARWDGGRLSGDNSLETDFNTVQIGYDVKNPNAPVRVGWAMSYTDGDSDFARGSADLESWGLAAYATWTADNGFFADGVLRMAKAENDMKVEGLSTDLDNMALSVSGEIGQRFGFAEGIYLEPQAEVTYTYINDDKFALGTNTYRLDSTTSLLGRLGAAAGWTIADRADVYLRASVVHEFLGDATLMGFAADGRSNSQTIDGEDTWVEFGVGGNVTLSKNAYLWGDVERTEGGEIDEDWRATVGVRYAW